MATKLDITRQMSLGVNTMIYLMCFLIAGLSLYYLSAIALDSFQTSSVFLGTLISALILLVISVWGCHRAKDVRSQTFAGRRRFPTLLFFSMTFVCFAAFIFWTDAAWSAYAQIRDIESQPIGYWYDNPGKEERVLFNFATEFNEMWIAGGCSGNDCVTDGCPGDCFSLSACPDPIELTPLVCTDDSMQHQFSNWIGQYTGTALVFQKCVALVYDIMDIPGFPSATWCESRTYLMNTAKHANLLMFYFTLIQSIMIFVGVGVVVMYMWMVRDLLKTDQLNGIDWLIYRSQFDASRWFSEDSGRKTPEPVD